MVNFFANLVDSPFFFPSFLILDEEGTEKTNFSEDGSSCELEESKLQLQLAIVGRPNVGKSTLLNTLLQEERVLVGPEAGLTRDSIRAQFEFQGRTIYLVHVILFVSCCFFPLFDSHTRLFDCTIPLPPFQLSREVLCLLESKLSHSG